MKTITRRYFLLSTGALSVGCVARPSNTKAPANLQVRSPAIGQSWEYSKHDHVSKVLVDVETDRVSAVGQVVELESRFKTQATGSSQRPSWGAQWLKQYRGDEEQVGVLPSEVQKPWGMVLVDPHWGELQVYERSIPLWPAELRPGWSTRINTTFKTRPDQGALPWQLTMNAHDWESVTVPAGQFNAIRYTNIINFRSADFSRIDSRRRETIWFAPEVGRWIARESSGTYFHDDSVDDRQVRGNSFRWELLSWS